MNKPTFKPGDEICRIPGALNLLGSRLKALEGKKLTVRGSIGSARGLMITFKETKSPRFPKNYKLYSEATPCERMGLAVGDKVEYILSEGFFEKGEILTLVADKGGNNGIFKDENGDVMGTFLPNIKPLKNTTRPTPPSPPPELDHNE